jgi:hypothetical protein
MQRRWTLASVILCMAFTACSSGALTNPESPARPSPSAIGHEEATAFLKKAVTRIADEPSTRYRFTLGLAHETVLEIEGVALNKRRWQATVRATEPGSASSTVMNVRSVGDTTWMQVEGWPDRAAGCWLPIGTRQVPVGIQGLTPGEPGYVSLLADLTTPTFTGLSRSAMKAELALPAASALLQAQLFRHIELSEAQASKGSVEVDVSYEGNRLTRVELSGGDMLRAIEKAGGSVTSTSRTVLENTNYRVDFLAPGTTISVTVPPKALVMTDLAKGCR